MESPTRTTVARHRPCRAFRALAVFVGLFASGLLPLPVVLGTARTAPGSEADAPEGEPGGDGSAAADDDPPVPARAARDLRRARPVAVALLPLPLQIRCGTPPAPRTRPVRSATLRC
ncbi:hypothetical protein [Gemmata sp.]|uniref:hypothetical protein n=1 Tax=Gemmata sp. TaxID=1914242 RepID=UPI003F6F9892